MTVFVLTMCLSKTPVFGPIEIENVRPEVYISATQCEETLYFNKAKFIKQGWTVQEAYCHPKVIIKK